MTEDRSVQEELRHLLARVESLEQKLKGPPDHETTFREMLDVVPDPIAVIEIEEGNGLRSVMANQAARTIFGLSEEEGKRIEEGVKSAVSDIITEDCRAACRSG